MNADKINSSNQLKNIINGAFSLTVSAIIVKLIGLIYKIPLANILSDEGMGYFNSAYTVYSFFYILCTAGVPKAVMILVSQAKARDNKIKEQQIIRICTKAFLLIGLIICIIFIVFSFPIARLIGNSKSAITMISIAPSILFISISGVLRGYLSANAKLFDIAISQIFEGLGKLIIGILLAKLAIKLNFSIEIISAFTIFGVTIGSIIGFIYLFVCSKNKISKDITGQIYQEEKTTLIEVFRISLPITISAAIMSLTNIIDLTMIMRNLISIGYTEATASALYGNYTTLAVPMLNLAIAVISPISIAFLPHFTKSYVDQNKSMAINGEKEAIKYTAFLSAPILVGLMLFSKQILDFLFPSSETIVGSYLLCILSPAVLFSSILIIINTMLEAYGKVKVPMISMAFGSISKIIASLFLIRNPAIGILGAPVGTVLSYAVALLLSLIIHSKVCGFNTPLLSSIVPQHLFAITSGIISKIIYNKIYYLGNVPSLIIAFLLFAIVYLCLIMVFESTFSKEGKIGKIYKFLQPKL